MDLHAPILSAPAEIDCDTPTTEDIAQQRQRSTNYTAHLLQCARQHGQIWSPCQNANGPHAPSQHVPAHCWKNGAKPSNLELISEATGLTDARNSPKLSAIPETIGIMPSQKENIDDLISKIRTLVTMEVADSVNKIMVELEADPCV